MFLELTNMRFQLFEDTSSDKAKNISSSTVAGMSAAVSFVPELQRDGGVPILLEYDSDAHFRPFYDESSAEPNKAPSTTVNGAVHGSGDDVTVGELPVFHRDGWDAIGDDPLILPSTCIKTRPITRPL